MNRGVYSAASGMVAAQQLLDIVTNNLANASTNGYKADGVLFANAMENQLQSQGSPIGSMGTGSAMVGQYVDFSAGSIVPSSNPMDVAINSPKGLFAVDANGTTSYTRDGAFTLDQNRQLVTKQGYPVLDGSKRPITIPQGQINIASNGDVTSDGKLVGRIGVFDGQFTKAGANLYAASSTQPIAAELAPGSIEASNVNAIQAMIQMITLSRTYELAQKSATQHDELTQKLIQSLQ